MSFSIASLSADGFTGWLSFPDARASGAIPATGGVYVVCYAARDPVAFLAASPAGRFKGKDPDLSASEVHYHLTPERPDPASKQQSHPPMGSLGL